MRNRGTETEKYLEATGKNEAKLLVCALVQLDYAFESSNLHIQMFYRPDVAPDSRGRNYTRVWCLLKNGRKRGCRRNNEIMFYFCFDVTKNRIFRLPVNVGDA